MNRKRVPLVWLYQVNERYGRDLTGKIIGCGRVQLGGYIRGSYTIPKRMKSSCLFILLCMAASVTKVQLTEMVKNQNVARDIPDKEIDAKKRTLKAIDDYRDRSDPDRAKHKKNINSGGLAHQKRDKELDFS